MAVRVENLGIAFGNKQVVHDVNLTLERSETLAIVGESGSGKSVTAAALAGLLPTHAQVTGSIKVNDLEITSASARQLRSIRGNILSYIFQEPLTALNPLHRIHKQIGEGLKLHQALTGEDLDNAIGSALDAVGLPNTDRIKNALPHELSGGQRQRVIIAAALANQPEFLVADEPTTALDATVERQVLDLLIEKQKSLGLGMIFITHDLRILPGLADRVVVMKNGHVVEVGATEDILNNPQEPYTQSLIAAGIYPARPPINKPEPILHVERMGVVYGKPKGFLRKSSEFRALEPISFDLGRGEALGLVGESGSGKSTLALGLMRLITTEGRVTLDGAVLDARDKDAIRSARRNIQMVFQDPFGSLSPRLSVGDIITEGLRIHEPNADRAAALANALETVGLPQDAADRYPHEFSGGQRQRISIARSLILRPKVMILDEPTSALDRTVQTQIVDLLIKLQDQFGMGYVFISHDFAVVRAICHRVMVLKNGRLIETGTTHDLFENPQEAYSQELVKAAL